MAVLKEIEENLKAISNIKAITKVYQEIANLRMKEIRQQVLDNRELIEELSKVYRQVKTAYFATSKTTPAIRKRGRVIVFLSSNTRFYGTLILDIWKKASDFLAKNEADLLVVGRMGKYFAERSGFGHKMFYFELSDEKPERERIKAIIEFIKNYEEIIVFHGKFKTILSQKAVQTNISSSIPSEEELVKVKPYLFEPSAEAVLDFFKRELICAFFNQTILEHSLSRYATRMVVMYQATENAEKIERKLKKERKKVERQLFNKKQVELFSSCQLWTPEKEYI